MMTEPQAERLPSRRPRQNPRVVRRMTNNEQGPPEGPVVHTARPAPPTQRVSLTIRILGQYVTGIGPVCRARVRRDPEPRGSVAPAAAGGRLGRGETRSAA